MLNNKRVLVSTAGRYHEEKSGMSSIMQRNVMRVGFVVIGLLAALPAQAAVVAIPDANLEAALLKEF